MTIQPNEKKLVSTWSKEGVLPETLFQAITTVLSDMHTKSTDFIQHMRDICSGTPLTLTGAEIFTNLLHILERYKKRDIKAYRKLIAMPELRKTYLGEANEFHEMRLYETEKFLRSHCNDHEPDYKYGSNVNLSMMSVPDAIEDGPLMTIDCSKPVNESFIPMDLYSKENNQPTIPNLIKEITMGDDNYKKAVARTQSIAAGIGDPRVVIKTTQDQVREMAETLAENANEQQGTQPSLLKTREGKVNVPQFYLRKILGVGLVPPFSDAMLSLLDSIGHFVESCVVNDDPADLLPVIDGKVSSWKEAYESGYSDLVALQLYALYLLNYNPQDQPTWANELGEHIIYLINTYHCNTAIYAVKKNIHLNMLPDFTMVDPEMDIAHAGFNIALGTCSPSVADLLTQQPPSTILLVPLPVDRVEPPVQLHLLAVGILQALIKTYRPIKDTQNPNSQLEELPMTTSNKHITRIQNLFTAAVSPINLNQFMRALFKLVLDRNVVDRNIVARFEKPLTEKQFDTWTDVIQFIQSNKYEVDFNRYPKGNEVKKQLLKTLKSDILPLLEQTDTAESEPVIETDRNKVELKELLNSESDAVGISLVLDRAYHYVENKSMTPKLDARFMAPLEGMSFATMKDALTYLVSDDYVIDFKRYSAGPQILKEMKVQLRSYLKSLTKDEEVPVESKQSALDALNELKQPTHATMFEQAANLGVGAKLVEANAANQRIADMDKSNVIFHEINQGQDIDVLLMVKRLLMSGNVNLSDIHIQSIALTLERKFKSMPYEVFKDVTYAWIQLAFLDSIISGYIKYNEINKTALTLIFSLMDVKDYRKGFELSWNNELMLRIGFIVDMRELDSRAFAMAQPTQTVNQVVEAYRATLTQGINDLWNNSQTLTRFLIMANQQHIQISRYTKFVPSTTIGEIMQNNLNGQQTQVSTNNYTPMSPAPTILSDLAREASDAVYNLPGIYTDFEFQVHLAECTRELVEKYLSTPMVRTLPGILLAQLAIIYALAKGTFIIGQEDLGTIVRIFQTRVVVPNLQMIVSPFIANMYQNLQASAPELTLELSQLKATLADLNSRGIEPNLISYLNQHVVVGNDPLKKGAQLGAMLVWLDHLNIGTHGFHAQPVQPVRQTPFMDMNALYPQGQHTYPTTMPQPVFSRELRSDRPINSQHEHVSMMSTHTMNPLGSTCGGRRMDMFAGELNQQQAAESSVSKYTHKLCEVMNELDDVDLQMAALQQRRIELKNKMRNITRALNLRG